jgi:hypothetical protein
VLGRFAKRVARVTCGDAVDGAFFVSNRYHSA